MKSRSILIRRGQVIGYRLEVRGGLAPLEVASPRSSGLAPLARARLLMGFTLIEVMIVMAIFALLASLGLIIGMDFYRSYSFNSERNVALAVLRKARTEAMVNVDQAAHGVRIE